MEDDAASIEEGEAGLKKLAEEARRQEVEALLSGEADGNDTFVEVHAGAGGTESQDWAEMLSRMYARWAGNHDYKVSLIEQSAGEEAGIKSATLQIKGENAYGSAQDRIGRAPAGAHLALRQQRAAAHVLRQRVGVSRGRREHRDRHQGERLPRRHLSCARAPAAST